MKPLLFRQIAAMQVLAQNVVCRRTWPHERLETRFNIVEYTGAMTMAPTTNKLADQISFLISKPLIGVEYAIGAANQL